MLFITQLVAVYVNDSVAQENLFRETFSIESFRDCDY